MYSLIHLNKCSTRENENFQYITKPSIKLLSIITVLQKIPIQRTKILLRKIYTPQKMGIYLVV